MTYTIGGKKFELRPLTHRQRYLASAIEQKMRKAILTIASLDATSPDALDQAFDVSVDMDKILFSNDEAFQKFLATILTPADAEKWMPAMVEQHKDLMWEITEDVQAEVLRDFFGRVTNSPLASPVSISPSTNEPKQSATSENQKDSTGETTT